MAQKRIIESKIIRFGRKYISHIVSFRISLSLIKEMFSQFGKKYTENSITLMTGLRKGKKFQIIPI